MTGLRFIMLFAVGVLAVSAFSGSDDKFIKKYAMMKIYESCFGQEVIREIREEMKVAVAKCAAMELEMEDDMRPAQLPTTHRPAPEPVKTSPPVSSPVPEPTQPPMQPQPMQQDTKGLLTESQIQNGNEPSNYIKGFDPEKLHQAILSYRPLSQSPAQPSLRPLQMQGSNYFPQPMFGQFPGFPGQYNNFPNFNNPSFNPANMFNNPFPPQFPFYSNAPYGNYHNGRLSRELDLNFQVDNLRARLSGKVRNVTCVMQELGYLNNNLEPTYDKIIEKINSLDIQDELKKDIEDGIDFCKQFSQCIPESPNDKSPFSNVLMKPMFFFRCYKHKKLEACILKDVRERFAGVAEDSIDNIPDQELFRRAKSLKVDKKDKVTSSEELTSDVFDFLFGNESDLNDIL